MGKEFLTIYWREMIRFVRFRAMLFASLIQPALWMAFFGLAMSSNFDSITDSIPVAGPMGMSMGVAIENSIDYLTFMAPGIMAMTTLFTSLFGGISILFDKNWGMMKEMLVSPMPRHHILIGIGLGGVTKSMIQVAIIMVFGMVIGADLFSGFSLLGIVVGLLGIFAFVAAFSLGFLFLSAMISMKLESMEGVQATMTLLTMPLFFASSALYPIDAFPEWLKWFAKVNPLTYLVKGLRYFTVGDDFYAMGTHYTTTVGEVLSSFIILTAFALVMYILAWNTFRKATVE